VDEDRVRNVVRRAWAVLVAAAIVDAVRKQRLHGELFGFVPYDFRVPDVDRARRRTWNPDSSRVLAPTTFGVGWSVNLGRIARLAGIV
jgi:hypothetical protein